MDFDRRDFLTATGATLGATALPAGVATAEPTHSYQVRGFAPVPGAQEAVVEGGWAYVAHPQGLATVDVSNPERPTPSAVVRGAGNEIKDVKVAPASNASERDVDVAATADDGGDGVTFFDVSDPANPERLSVYRAAGGVHNMFLQGDSAYLCVNEAPAENENGEPPAVFSYARMVVVDVSDPENPTSLEGGVEAGADHDDADDGDRGSGGAWMLRDVQRDMATAGINPIHDIYVQAGLAYLCFWDAGLVVVDVTDRTDPRAVAHFGAVDYADQKEPNPVRNELRYSAEGGNAHYVQPTPDGNYTFVGAETFPGPSVPPGVESGEHPLGEHGGIRVFDTREVDTLEGNRPGIYPSDADDQDPVGQPHASNPTVTPKEWEHVAFVPAPEQPDDAALTSHNFDVTDGRLFASFYQGGIRAYDVAPTLGGRHDDPEELAAFAPDGTAFWTAENLDTGEDATYTVGSDIGKGLLVLELTDDSTVPSLGDPLGLLRGVLGGSSDGRSFAREGQSSRDVDHHHFPGSDHPQGAE